MIERDSAAGILQAALSRGGDSAQLFVERTSSTTLRLDGGRLDEAAAGVDQGVGLSLLEGDRTLYANGNKLDHESLMKMAERLSRSVAIGAEIPRAVPLVFRQRPLAMVSPVLV
ncbi:MAG TPA: DNA gyrase modulator, partial [Patescibacteria group bacterium]|nr:DNA gyrase modulator [Patescibacteria group bacterium]